MKKLLIGLLLMSGSAFAQDLSLGLRAYYPFNGNANDASGNGNNPVFNNATLTSDKFGNPNSAYHFNGTNTYMRVLNSSTLNMGVNISLAARVRPTGFYTGTCYNNAILFKGDDDYLLGDYFLRFADIEYGCSTPSSSRVEFRGFLSRAYNVFVQLNQWYDVVWTNDGVTEKIYVNCVLRDSRPATASTFSNSYDLYIGRMNHVNYPYWLNGDLDEIRIYDRALTQNEVNLYSGCSVLAVNLTQFTTSVINNENINLSWNTSEESDVTKYIIERAVAGSTDYTILGETLPNHRAGTNNYSFTDVTAVPNILYNYRIRIATLDGNQKYSSVKNAKIINNAVYTSIYPNPARETIKLQVNNYSGMASVSTINSMGKMISISRVNVIPGNPILLDIRSLPAGTYWINIQTGSDKTVKKIVKL